MLSQATRHIRNSRTPFLNYYVKESGRVGVIELNNPENRHALSLEMLRQFQQAIDYMEGKRECCNDAHSVDEKFGEDSRHDLHDPDDSNKNNVRVVIIQATPTATSPDNSNAARNATNVFCSGHDLKQIQQYQAMEWLSSSRAPYTPKAEQQSSGQLLLHELYETCSNVMMSITKSKIPYIAKINGITTAAGCQLVATCDLAYATSHSKFVTPGNFNIGLFCSTPSVALLQKNTGIPRKHITEMLLLGQPISATKASVIGLINDVSETEEDLDEKVDDVANLIATQTSYDTLSRFGKSTIHEVSNVGTLADAYNYATNVMVDNSLTEDCRDGIDSFLSKRKPKWKN